MPEDEKTEDASQRRIDQAREKGDVPKSRELNSAIALLLGLLTLRFFAQFSLGGLKDMFRYFQFRSLFLEHYHSNKRVQN